MPSRSKKAPKFKMDGADNAPYDICLDPFSHYSPDGFYACLSIHIVGKNRTTRLCPRLQLLQHRPQLRPVGERCADPTVQQCGRAVGPHEHFIALLQEDGYIGMQFRHLQKAGRIYHCLQAFSTLCQSVDFVYILIFVSVTGREAFSLGENSIRLHDFEDNFYEIGFQGNLIRQERVKR